MNDLEIIIEALRRIEQRPFKNAPNGVNAFAHGIEQLAQKSAAIAIRQEILALVVEQRLSPRTPPMTDLAGLIERLEGAGGPLDIETLGRVICAAQRVEFSHAHILTGDDGSDELNVYRKGKTWPIWCQYRSQSPDASTDAALALAEGALPNCDVEFGKYGSEGRTIAFVLIPSTSGYGSKWSTHQGSHPTSIPIALLIATLRALQASTGEGEG